MKIPRSSVITIALISLLITALTLPAGANEKKEIFYAVEINNTLCGYAELEVYPFEH